MTDQQHQEFIQKLSRQTSRYLEKLSSHIEVKELSYKARKDESGATKYIHESEHGENGIEIVIAKQRYGGWAASTANYLENFIGDKIISPSGFSTKAETIDKINRVVNEKRERLARKITLKTAKIYKNGFAKFMSGVTNATTQDRYLKGVAEYACEWVNYENRDIGFSRSITVNSVLTPENMVLLASWNVGIHLFGASIQVNDKDVIRYILVNNRGYVQQFGDNVLDYVELKESIVTEIRKLYASDSKNMVIDEYMRCLKGRYLIALKRNHDEPERRFLITDVKVDDRIVRANLVGKNDDLIGSSMRFVLDTNGNPLDLTFFLNEFHCLDRNGFTLKMSENVVILNKLKHKVNLDALGATLEYSDIM